LKRDQSTDAIIHSQVTPDTYTSPDIICHKSAKPGKAHIPVVAGQSVQLFWNTWPPGHSGPILDYLAPCANNDCSTVDKTALKFAKIDQVGLHNGPAPGNWAVNDLVANNNSWTVTIPASLKAGAYVLRHEIISLHAARTDNQAQNYPQCVNLSKFRKKGRLSPLSPLALSFEAVWCTDCLIRSGQWWWIEDSERRERDDFLQED
jgi:hypothetical protein